jgi:hypothetical protein
MSVLIPEATPDKALRIFATLVRDQESTDQILSPCPFFLQSITYADTNNQ